MQSGMMHGCRWCPTTEPIWRASTMKVLVSCRCCRAGRPGPACLPDDPVPSADAIVSVGHPLSYLDDEDQLNRSIHALAEALNPDGVIAFDICDVQYGDARRDDPPQVWFGDDWVLITRTSVPRPTTFRRDMTMFVRSDPASWRRSDEVHDNVLIDTTKLPSLLQTHGVQARIGVSFGSERLPIGLVTVVGMKPAGDTKARSGDI